jgi:membrane-bound lytic murein transglycosylase B
MTATLRNRGKVWALAVAVALSAIAAPPAAAAAAQTPRQWVEAYWPTAREAGISRKVYDAALGNFTPDSEVIKKANTQAEFNTAIWYYMDMMVSDERLTEGAAALTGHGGTLAAIESRYGVDRYIVAAIWGIESHYGRVLDRPGLIRNVVRSLATLAYTGGRRAKFGRQQLIAALKIIQRGDISVTGMTGSWAGAMGHTQFIPTTYNAYAVDFDGDGRRNIWTSEADALASAANYLRAAGWQSGNTWGYEVEVPRSHDIRKTKERTIGEWEKVGIRRVGGQGFPRKGDKAALFAPAGRGGPIFLTLTNFRVIKRYNNANSYALAVGHLADRLRGGAPFVAAWPEHEKPLTTEERIRLQQHLTVRGFYSGEIDGDIGSGSREAIRAFQLKAGLRPDGVETRNLLRLLEESR